jgi:hypothetical protein
MLQYTIKKHRKIGHIFKRHKVYLDSIKNKGREDIDIYDDEEYAYDNFIFINNVFEKDDGILLFSMCLECNLGYIRYDKKKRDIL